LLADLLSVPTGDRYPPLGLTPQKRKEKTLHTLLAQIEGLAARQPVLIVFEDIHRSDPSPALAFGSESLFHSNTGSCWQRFDEGRWFVSRATRTSRVLYQDYLGRTGGGLNHARGF
jgi:hypothetical protein